MKKDVSSIGTFYFGSEYTKNSWSREIKYLFV